MLTFGSRRALTVSTGQRLGPQSSRARAEHALQVRQPTECRSGTPVGITAQWRGDGPQALGAVTSPERLSRFGAWDNAVAFIDNITFHPVPEPSSWLLLSLGIAGVVMIRRKLASRA